MVGKTKGRISQMFKKSDSKQIKHLFKKGNNTNFGKISANSNFVKISNDFNEMAYHIIYLCRWEIEGVYYAINQ